MFGLKKKTRRSCETCRKYLDETCEAWPMFPHRAEPHCNPHDYGVRCEDWQERVI